MANREWCKALRDVVQVWDWDKAIKVMEDAPPKSLSKEELAYALSWACFYRQPKAVKAALALGAKPERECLINMGRWLGKKHSVEDWKACIAEMCAGDMKKLDDRSIYGCAALHHALRDKHWEWSGEAMALLDLGANPWLRTEGKETVAELAARYGHVAVWRRIKALGDQLGKKVALSMEDACLSRNPEMVALALSEGGNPAGFGKAWSEDVGKGERVVEKISYVDMARREPWRGQNMAESQEGRPDGGPEVLSMLLSAIEAKKIRASLGKKKPAAGSRKKQPL